MASNTTVTFTGPRSDFDYSIYLTKVGKFEPDALKDHILKYRKAVTHCVFDSDVVYKLNSEMRNTITSLKLFKKHEKPDFLQMVGNSYEELLTKFWKCKNAVDGLTDYEWSSEEDQKLQAFAYFAYISRQAYKVRTSSNLTTITEEPHHVPSAHTVDSRRSPSVTRSATTKPNMTKAELLLQQSIARSSKMFKAYTPIPEDLVDDEEMDGYDLLDRLDLEDADDQADILFGKIRSDNSKYVNHYKRYGRSASQQ